MRSFTFAIGLSLIWGQLGFSQSMPFDPREATVDTVHNAVFSGLSTCREVISAFIARVEEYNNLTNSVLVLNPNALDIADSLDESLAAGNTTGPLFCVPVLLKDNYDTKDMPKIGRAHV